MPLGRLLDRSSDRVTISDSDHMIQWNPHRGAELLIYHSVINGHGRRREPGRGASDKRTVAIDDAMVLGTLSEMARLGTQLRSRQRTGAHD